MRSKLEFPMRQIFRRQRESLRKFSEKMQIPKSDTKEMVVFVDELADSAVIMGLRVRVSTERYGQRNGARNSEDKKEEFDANGIVIPYNQMEVYVHQQK